MNAQRIQKLTQSQGYPVLPIRHGMQLEIHEEVGEGDNKRTWKFKGLVIKVQNPKQSGGTFTIRGKSSGNTIEKIYPLSFRKFQKVLLLDEYKTARAKLYYIRDKVGKDAKMTSLLTQDEKGIDLLEVAIATATQAQAVVNPDPIEPKQGDQSQETPEQPTEIPEATPSQPETQEENTPEHTQETPEQPNEVPGATPAQEEIEK